MEAWANKLEFALIEILDLEFVETWAIKPPYQSHWDFSNDAKHV